MQPIRRIGPPQLNVRPYVQSSAVVNLTSEFVIIELHSPILRTILKLPFQNLQRRSPFCFGTASIQSLPRLRTQHNPSFHPTTIGLQSHPCNPSGEKSLLQPFPLGASD
ncbi:MAG: hypothetical protein ACTS41_01685 [Candidatus Hodgkinia cicadicola]